MTGTFIQSNYPCRWWWSIIGYQATTLEIQKNPQQMKTFQFKIHLFTFIKFMWRKLILFWFKVFPVNKGSAEKCPCSMSVIGGRHNAPIWMKITMWPVYCVPDSVWRMRRKTILWSVLMVAIWASIIPVMSWIRPMTEQSAIGPQIYSSSNSNRCQFWEFTQDDLVRKLKPRLVPDS